MKSRACYNGDGRPVAEPSIVLCAECFASLDAKIKAAGEKCGASPVSLAFLDDGEVEQMRLFT
jgi:hypothetical protein